MHYPGMAAMRVYSRRMMGDSGAGSEDFLLPLLLGITLVSFVLALLTCVSPSEAEIRDDADFNVRLEALRRQTR